MQNPEPPPEVLLEMWNSVLSEELCLDERIAVAEELPDLLYRTTADIRQLCMPAQFSRVFEIAVAVAEQDKRDEGSVYLCFRLLMVLSQLCMRRCGAKAIVRQDPEHLLKLLAVVIPLDPVMRKTSVYHPYACAATVLCHVVAHCDGEFMRRMLAGGMIELLSITLDCEDGLSTVSSVMALTSVAEMSSKHGDGDDVSRRMRDSRTFARLLEALMRGNLFARMSELDLGHCLHQASCRLLLRFGGWEQIKSEPALVKRACVMLRAAHHRCEDTSVKADVMDLIELLTYLTLHDSPALDGAMNRVIGDSVGLTARLRRGMRQVEHAACMRCHKAAPREALMTCSGCKTAKYCGKTCQRADWSKHKAVCQARE